jgi:hypothetical protein
MNKHLLLGASAAVVAAAAAFASTDRADAGGLRQVKFTQGSLRPVFAGSMGKGVTNYCLDYKVANTLEKAVKPGVRLELRTETNKTFGDCYDQATWAAAKKLLGAKEDLGLAATIRANELAAGASVDALANFGAVDPNADKLTVRVYGLWDPVYRDRQGRTWAETRVLVLSYSRVGDEYDRQYDEIRLDSAKEEVEKEPVQLNAAK